MRKGQVFSLTIAKTEFTRVAENLGLLGWRGLLVLARRVRKAVDPWLKIPQRNYDENLYAEEFCIRSIQDECFSHELYHLRRGKNVHNKSRILNL